MTHDFMEDEAPTTYATLRLAGPAPLFQPTRHGVVDPWEITAILNLEPTSQRRIVDAEGRCVSGSWHLSTENHVQSESLEEHLVWILDRIEPRIPELRRYLDGRDVLADYSCLWIVGGQRGLLLSAEVMARLGATGIRLDIYVYSGD